MTESCGRMKSQWNDMCRQTVTISCHGGNQFQAVMSIMQQHLEEMEAAELEAPDLPLVDVRNIYFDITPAHLISGWITELGLVRDWTGRL